MTSRNGHGRFNLDAAAEAAAAEGDAEPFPFCYKGANYEVPPATRWPLRAQMLLGEGELAQALALLIGATQVQRLSDAGITVGELNLLFEAIGKAAGVENLPNSPGPALAGSTQT